MEELDKLFRILILEKLSDHIAAACANCKAIAIFPREAFSQNSSPDPTVQGGISLILEVISCADDFVKSVDAMKAAPLPGSEKRS